MKFTALQQNSLRDRLILNKDDMDVFDDFRQIPPAFAKDLNKKSRQNPFSAEFQWGRSNADIWDLMCWKDDVYRRDPTLLNQHPTIKPIMRSILLEWIAEVKNFFFWNGLLR